MLHKKATGKRYVWTDVNPADMLYEALRDLEGCYWDYYGPNLTLQPSKIRIARVLWDRSGQVSGSLKHIIVFLKEMWEQEGWTW